MRTLVLGDIHGHFKSLVGLLQLVNYNNLSDRLICIGDYVDGGADSFEVVEHMLEIDMQSERENIFLIGNHCKTFLDVLDLGLSHFRDRERVEEAHWQWYNNGGMATYDSYIVHSDEEIIRHREQFFRRLKYYHLEDNKLFVHAGYDFTKDIESCYNENKEELLWDRHLYKSAITDHSDNSKGRKFGDYDKIYIGHTPTFLYGDETPRMRSNVINVDQGSKVNRKLTAWIDETDDWFQFSPSS